MPGRAVIFDLDGTLLDTLDDIASAANRVLAASGYPVHDRESYRQFIGDGSKLLMTRALPPAERSAEQIQASLQAFFDDYRHNWHRQTKPYDGILDLLQGLQARRIGMAVVSNKPHHFTVLSIDYYFSHVRFYSVLGQRQGVPIKPDPQQALAAASAMGVVPGECIFLGDSAVDMETALRAGMHPAGAAWGFRSQQELLKAGAPQVIEHPREMWAMLGYS